MPLQTIPGCGADPSSSGWYSSLTGGSFSWSPCKKPNNKGLLGTENAYNKEDGGYRYMYRHWDVSNNDNIYGKGNGYNQLTGDNISYVSNANPSSANNGSTYNKIPKSFNVKNYESSNIVRQPCNRGPKMVLPTLGTEWVSTIPAATGGTSGWKGHIWNYSGGTEGWLDQPGKFKWTDGFKNRIYELIKNKGIGTRKDFNEYLVEKKKKVLITIKEVLIRIHGLMVLNLMEVI